MFSVSEKAFHLLLQKETELWLAFFLSIFIQNNGLPFTAYGQILFYHCHNLQVAVKSCNAPCAFRTLVPLLLPTLAHQIPEEDDMFSSSSHGEIRAWLFFLKLPLKDSLKISTMCSGIELGQALIQMLPHFQIFRCPGA